MSKKNKQTAVQIERYVYLAPSFGGFMTHTVFVGKMPQKLKEIIKKYPDVKRFVVPESKAQSIIVRLKDKNDPIKILYDKLSLSFRR